MSSLRILFILALLAVPAFPAAALSPSDLSADDAYDLLHGEEQVYLLDVRTLQEYMQVRIPGARLIPYEQVQRRLRELPRDRPILVYCAIGSRSSRVVDYLSRRGLSQVYNLFGGVGGWQLRGYPVFKGPP